MPNTDLLSNIKAGQHVKLIRVKAGRRFSHRLAELGLTPGIEFSVVQDTGGPILLSVRNSRIALGRGMATKIIVQLLGESY